VLDARPRDLGGGLQVGRVLPVAARRAVGPVVLLDDIGPGDLDAPGASPTGMAVRPHPHVHLATVTYLFEGEILHRDSLGSRQLIQPGAINWMNAGRGIAHSERSPRPDGPHGRIHGLQLWVGLPRAAEDSAPSFEHQPVTALPVMEGDGVWARVLAGAAFGVRSPVTSLAPVVYAELRVQPGARLAVPTEVADRGLYVVDGEITLDGRPIAARHLAVLERGAAVVLRATTAARVMLLGGEPLDGPRYMWWNFVGSSQDQLVEAARRWRAREFPAIPDDDVELTPAPDGPRFARPHPESP
ncbi:MAG: pirin family protein, partial [Myxococcales bacterium]|nr:pirin family protein [Myxococcales bacterium]